MPSDYKRNWLRARRARWKAAGCCPHCGQPTRRYVYCATERFRRARKGKRRRDQALKLTRAEISRLGGLARRKSAVPYPFAADRDLARRCGLQTQRRRRLFMEGVV